jgi:hypothetical protein
MGELLWPDCNGLLEMKEFGVGLTLMAWSVRLFLARCTFFFLGFAIFPIRFGSCDTRRST